MARVGSRILIAALVAISLIVLTARRAGVANGVDRGRPRLEQLQGLSGCLVQRTRKGCRTVRALYGPEKVIVSPDGRNAYVTSDEFREITALVSFARKPDGRLVQLAGRAGCLRLIAADGCAVLPHGTLRDIISSPDGRFLYAAVGHHGDSPADGILVLARDTSTGELHPLPAPAGCLNKEGARGCVRGRPGMGSPYALAISPDGRNVYAATIGALEVYTRDTNSGQLEQLPGTAGCVDEHSRQCTRVRPLDVVPRSVVHPGLLGG